MATRSERFEVYTSFVREGDPNQIVSDLKKVEDAAKKTGQSVQQSGQAAQKAGAQKALAARDVKGLSGALQQASESTHQMGAALTWMNVPGAQFMTTAGNMLQGTRTLGMGLAGLAGGMPPLAVGLALGTAAIVGFGIALHAAARSAEEFIGRIRDVSQTTGLSLEQASRDLAAMQGMFGAEGAMSVYGNITQAQAGLSPMQTMSQQAFSKLSPGDRPFAPDAFSRWGLSLVEQGSTPTSPLMKDPMRVLFESARRGNQLDKSQQALFLNQMGPQVGGKDQLSYVMRQFQQGATADSLRGKGIGAFAPTDAQVKALDQFTTATNGLALEFGQLKAELGQGVLPLFTAFISGLTDFARGVREGIRVLGELTKPLAPLGPLFEKAAFAIGKVFVPALLLLAAVVLVGFSPVIAIVLAVIAVVTALLSVLGMVGKPAKETGDNLNYLAVAWKGADFPGMGGAAKAWGDAAENAFFRVGAAKDALIQKLAQGWASMPIPLPIPLQVTLVLTGAESIYTLLESLRKGVIVPVTLPLPDLTSWKTSIETEWAALWAGGPVVVPSPVPEPMRVPAWLEAIRKAWGMLWQIDGPVLVPAPAFIDPTPVIEQLYRSVKLAWDNAWLAFGVLWVPLVQWLGTINIPQWIDDNVTKPWTNFWNEHPLLNILARPVLPSIPKAEANVWARAQAQTAITSISEAFGQINTSQLTAGLGAVLLTAMAAAMIARPGLAGVLAPAGAAVAAMFGLTFMPNAYGGPGIAAAEGAIVSKPMLSWVGEAGPEAIIPLNRMPGAMELPAGLGQGIGGGVGNITVYVQGFDFSDRASIERVARAVGDRIMSNVRTMSSVGQIA